MSAAEETVIDLPAGQVRTGAELPPDLAVTIGRRDLGWAASEAFYSVRVPLIGDGRLFYAPDIREAETWVYRWSPDLAERREALAELVEAGGLSGPVEERRFASMVACPLWAQVRAHGVESWMDLEGPGSLDALSAVGAVEALIPADIWGWLVRRRQAWQAERDRATWRRSQREVHALMRDQAGRAGPGGGGR